MKSTLIEFIEQYRDSKLSDEKLRSLFSRKVDKEDFDQNRSEVWSWFLEMKKQRQTSIML
jgi:hypothetical protein